MKHRNAMTQLVSRAGFLTGVLAASTAIWAFSAAAKSREIQPMGTSSSGPTLTGLHSCPAASKRYLGRTS